LCSISTISQSNPDKSYILGSGWLFECPTLYWVYYFLMLYWVKNRRAVNICYFCQGIIIHNACQCYLIRFFWEFLWLVNLIGREFSERFRDLWRRILRRNLTGGNAPPTLFFNPCTKWEQFIFFHHSCAYVHFLCFGLWLFRQMFEITIQAAIGSKVIARET
jgi:hypothetical protein